MSGFEVAGLVLGALPLIISAIEHYDASLDRAKAFYRYEEELENAMSELWLEHSYYEMTLQLLLKDVVSGSELQGMFAETGSPLWKSKDLAEELELKLGSGYKGYLYLVKKIEQQMKSLSQALNIDRHPETANELEAIIKGNRPILGAGKAQPKFQFRRRIKFTMKKDAIGKLTGNIIECNQRLERFIEKAEKMDQSVIVSKSKPRSTMAVPLQAIHDYAGRLYHVLSQAWNSCAHHSHCTNLLLEHRMVRRERKRGRLGCLQNDSAPTFTLSFDRPALDDWHVAEVKIIKEIDIPSPNVQSQVRFSVSPATSTSLSNNISLETLELDSLEPSTPHLKIIENLCSTLHSYDRPNSCCGFSLDLQGILRGTYEATQRPMRVANRLVTLEDVLFSPKTQTWLPLTEDDRRVLAITLASSFLQLHRTPWVGDQWSKTEIVFPVAKNDQCRVDVKHPFVTKTYATSSTKSRQSYSTIYSSAAATSSSSDSHDDSVNLLTLAKILLEIRLNDRVENLRRSEDLGPGQVLNEAADIQTLRRWIKKEQGNLSFELNDAVRYCMKAFADPGTDLCSLTFRQDVVDNVVVPLLEELYVWREGPAR